MSVLLALATLCHLAQTPGVTIASQGESLKQAVQETGKQSGQSLTVSRGIEDHRVVIFLKDAPVKDVLALLAEEETGKWVDDGQTKELVADVAEQVRRQQAKRQALVDVWKKKLQRMREMGGVDQFDEGAAAKLASRFDLLTDRRNNGDLNDFVRLEEAGYSLPSGRALVKILTDIGPEKLADLGEGYSEFSIQPNSLQLPIGDDATKILQQYKSEQSTWNENPLVGSKTLGLIEEGGAKADISQGSGMIMRLASHGDRGVAVLEIYDGAGRIIQTTDSTLSVDDVEAMKAETNSLTKDMSKPLWADIPSLSIQLYRVRDERPGREQILQMWESSPEFKRTVEHPELSDLDGLIFGQQALALARAKNLLLIVPEDCQARYLEEKAFKENQLNVNVLETRLAPIRTDLGKPEQFVIPRDLLDPAKEWATPTAQGEFFRTAMNSDEITLDMVANLFIGATSEFVSGANLNIESTVLKAVKPDQPGWGWIRNPPNVLAFYGGLAEEQRDQARSNGLSLIALDTANWNPLLASPWSLNRSIKIDTLPAKGENTIYTDPFVFFGVTDSRQGSLKMQNLNEGTIEFKQDGMERYETAEVWHVYHKKNAERGGPETDFRSASRQNVKIVFVFKNAEMQLVLSCDDAQGPKTARYQDLPEELKKNFPIPKSG